MAYNQTQFIKKANCVHKNRYTYDNLVYIGIKSKIIVTCPVHGNFSITGDKHINSKQGCQKCATEKRKCTTEQFIEKARRVHGDTYDYSLVKYVDNREKVKIICKKHGVFEQEPVTHSRRDAHGCPKCAFEITKHDYQNLPTIVYYVKLEVDSKVLYKIGITLVSRGIRKRFANFKGKVTVLHTEKFTTGHEAFLVEQVLLELTNKFQYTGPSILTGGNTEIRTKDVLCLDTCDVKSRGFYQQLLKLGNHKLGSLIGSWSIPATQEICGRECPGCYAIKAQKIYPGVLPSRTFRYNVSKTFAFTPLMIQAIRILTPKYVRIFESGEFYSQEHVNKWEQIARAEKHVTFYAYTKRLKDFNFSLLKDLPNVVIIDSLQYGGLNYGELKNKPAGSFLCPDYKGSELRKKTPKGPICGNQCTYCMTKEAEATGVYFVKH